MTRLSKYANHNNDNVQDTAKLASEQYLDNFDKMPLEKQQQHLLIIVRCIVALLRDESTA